MSHWDDSDTEIEAKYNELDAELITISQRKRQLGIFRDKISSLKMIEEKTSNTNGSVEVNYVQPKNTAGNDMEEDYRIKQKADLLVNINNYLNITEEE